MTQTSAPTPVRLPVGNSGREYAVDAGSGPFGVHIVPMTGRRELPSQVADLQARHARALGVALIELGGYAAVNIDDPRPAAYRTFDTFHAFGGRGYRAVLRPVGTSTRRVRLLVVNVDGEILPSLSDSFTGADARTLGVALITAAGIADARQAAL